MTRKLKVNFTDTGYWVLQVQGQGINKNDSIT